MRRDQFTAAVRTPDGRPPTLDIVYDGPADELDSRLSANGEPLTADGLDAAFRRRAPPEDEDADDTGVFSLTRRLTGGYLLEVNVDTGSVRGLVAAAREVDDDASYHIRISRGDEERVVYEMSTLLVYDSSGELLRQRSLIPSGVEL